MYDRYYTVSQISTHTCNVREHWPTFSFAGTVSLNNITPNLLFYSCTVRQRFILMVKHEIILKVYICDSLIMNHLLLVTL